ncbi:hypothetical protein CEXT_180281, partial [Caerostris extrusa]
MLRNKFHCFVAHLHGHLLPGRIFHYPMPQVHGRLMLFRGGSPTFGARNKVYRLWQDLCFMSMCLG